MEGPRNKAPKQGNGQYSDEYIKKAAGSGGKMEINVSHETQTEFLEKIKAHLESLTEDELSDKCTQKDIKLNGSERNIKR